VQATVNGEAATAAWLARLRALPEVEAVTVREMKRATVGGGRDNERQRGPLQVIAHLAWAGAAASEAQAASRQPAGKLHARSGK
jgi:type IV pilus assembly protein PilN